MNNSQNIIDKNIKEIKEQINIKIQKYKNISLKFSKEESDIKNIIETKLIRAAEIAVNQELNEEQRKIVTKILK